MSKDDNNKINLIISVVILLIGLILLLFPIINLNKPLYILYIVFAIYTILKLGEYLLASNSADKENLYTAIICGIYALSGFKFIQYDSALVLSLTLISWIGIMSIIKLIKLDYYDDRQNGMFYINLVTFGLFLIIGILTSINLYFSKDVQTIILGYFLTINGILAVIESGVKIIAVNDKLKIKENK